MEYQYYKFPNKESVPSLELWPSNVSVYEVGIIKRKDEVMDEWGNEIEPAEYFDGWHINVCFEEKADLDFIQQYRINVSSPDYLWYGQQNK
jgi:hypothetical protein